jgi:hypothetical protein
MDETGKKKILGPLALFNPPHFYLLILIPTRYIGYPIYLQFSSNIYPGVDNPCIQKECSIVSY